MAKFSGERRNSAEKRKKRRRDGSYLISSRRKGYEVEKTSENLTDGMKESTLPIP